MRKLTKFFVPMLLAILVLLPVTQADQVAAASKFEDGEYNLSFQVLDASGSKTSAADEFLSSTAKLNVKDGQNTLTVTITSNASMLETMSVNGTSGSKSGSTFTFNNVEISQTGNGSMKVNVPDLYEETYNVVYKFGNLPSGQSSGSDTGDEGESTTGSPAPEENPPTGDNAPILLLSIVLLASGIFLVRKLAVK